MKWHAMNTTSVETFSFYLTSDNGHAALAQVIYSNVAYVVAPTSQCLVEVAQKPC
jgi:hypothetical protein